MSQEALQAAIPQAQPDGSLLKQLIQSAALADRPQSLDATQMKAACQLSSKVLLSALFILVCQSQDKRRCGDKLTPVCIAQVFTFLELAGQGAKDNKQVAQVSCRHTVLCTNIRGLR